MISDVQRAQVNSFIHCVIFGNNNSQRVRASFAKIRLLNDGSCRINSRTGAVLIFGS